mgnify:CR=1 FL=1
MRTLVQGGLVVRHDGVRKADVLLEDERIVEVGEGLSASGACVVDATDCYVLPGGVDAQVRPAGAGLGVGAGEGEGRRTDRFLDARAVKDQGAGGDAGRVLL